MTMMTTKTGYERWMAEEGLPVVDAFGITDVMAVPRGDWPRMGARGAFMQLAGMEGITGLYVCEIPPGQSTRRERHMYDELIYVLSGRGATEVWVGSEHQEMDSSRTLFEWEEGSLFAPPMNCWHRLSNGSGTQPV